MLQKIDYQISAQAVLFMIKNPTTAAVSDKHKIILGPNHGDNSSFKMHPRTQKNNQQWQFHSLT